jgi:hypothetical protein
MDKNTVHRAQGRHIFSSKNVFEAPIVMSDFQEAKHVVRGPRRSPDKSNEELAKLAYLDQAKVVSASPGAEMLYSIRVDILGQNLISIFIENTEFLVAFWAQYALLPNPALREPFDNFLADVRFKEMFSPTTDPFIELPRNYVRLAGCGRALTQLTLGEASVHPSLVSFPPRLCG